MFDKVWKVLTLLFASNSIVNDYWQGILGS